MLSGCATVRQSPYDLRDRMNSVRIGMTHQEVENLIGKPTFVTSNDASSGRMEICDYTIGTLNTANFAQSFNVDTAYTNGYISIVVVYNNDMVLSIQRYYDIGSVKDMSLTQSDNRGKNRTAEQSYQVENIQSPIDDTAKGSNPEQSRINAKLRAGVHVNSNMNVTSVVVDSPADKAGLKINDIILAFDGIPVTDTTTLKRITDTVTFGDKKVVRIQRGDRDF